MGKTTNNKTRAEDSNIEIPFIENYINVSYLIKNVKSHQT